MRRKESGAITAADLAALCGVSQGTVDRALHGRGEIRAETRERILKVAAEYGYVPNVSARRLAGGKSGLVGVVVFDLRNEYFSELIMYLEERFCAAGLLPVIMFSNKDPETERSCIRKLCTMGVEGIVLMPIGEDPSFEKELLNMKIPVVTVGNRLGDLPHIGIDDRLAMYELCSHVMTEAHKRYVYYSPALSHESENRYAQLQRHLGYLDAAREKGITPETVLKNAINVSEFDESTIVVASTDYYALRLVYGGLPVSRVTGFDNLGLLHSCRIPLVTVDGNSAAVADAVVAFFTDPNAREKSVNVPHRLITHKL